MLEVDLEKFWADDEIAHKNNCFSEEATQVALGIRMSDECVFSELGEEGEPWGHTERGRRISLNRRYNDLAEKIVGRRLLREDYPTEDEIFTEGKQIGCVFGGTYSYTAGSTWLHSDIKTEEALENRLDIIDKMNIREFILPFGGGKQWEDEKKRIFEKYGKKPHPYRHVRGPVTLATSIFGVENLIFLINDNEDLAKRFSDTICRVIHEYITVYNEEAGFDEKTMPHGFSFADDDSAVLNPGMYEFFGYPVLKSIFARMSPDENDARYQHSDSDMGHLIEILSRLNLTGCNFGPKITVTQIRKYMPRTRIDGQLAPFTFMRNDEAAIISEVKRDCEMARASGIKGLNLTTAGSINDGSRLTSMRAVMHAIQKFGQY